MNWFYTQNREGDLLILDEEEARHCTKTLRKKEGDELFLVDGQGGRYRGTLSHIHKKSCEVTIVEQIEMTAESVPPIHIAIAPTKNISRVEWFLEKSTEIGIASILPFTSKHSIRKVIRHDRLNKIIVSAMKQSGRSFLPVLKDLVSFEDLLSLEFEGEKFIAWCKADITQDIAKIHDSTKEALVLIGPEGGFSDEEIEMALSAGYKAVYLSPHRLRTETAALLAGTALNLLNR